MDYPDTYRHSPGVWARYNELTPRSARSRSAGNGAETVERDPEDTVAETVDTPPPSAEVEDTVCPDVEEGAAETLVLASDTAIETAVLGLITVGDTDVTAQDVNVTAKGDVTQDGNGDEVKNVSDDVTNITDVTETGPVASDMTPEPKTRPIAGPTDKALLRYWQCFTPVYNDAGSIIACTCKHCLLSICPKRGRMDAHLLTSPECRFSDADAAQLPENRCSVPSIEAILPNAPFVKKTSRCCFICGQRRVRLELELEAFSAYPGDWTQSISQSLCGLLGLEEAAQQILPTGTYCPTCAQLLRDINWVQRSLTSLTSRLDDLRNIVVRRITDCLYTAARSSDWASNKAAFVQNLKELELDVDVSSVSAAKVKSKSLKLPRKSGRKRKRTQKVEELFEILPNDPFEPETVEAFDPTEVNDPLTLDDNLCNDSDLEWNPAVYSSPEPKKQRSKRSKVKENRRSVSPASEEDKPAENDSKWQKWNRLVVPCPDERCKRRFTRPCKADTHFRKDHQLDPFPYHCGTLECELKFESRKKLEKHRKASHAGEKPARRARPKLSLPCPIADCGRIFRDRPSLNAHIRYVHHAKLNFLVCKYCTKKFKKSLNEAEAAAVLEEHETLHATNPVPFSCVLDSCAGQAFFTSRDLRHHVATAHEENRFHCPRCPDRIFVRKDGLTEHNRKMHSGKADIFHCAVEGCKYTTTVSTNLKSHSMAHSQERPFQCSQCDMTYKTKRNLQSHFNIRHSEETPYACQHCDLKFKSTRLLNMHELTHTANSTSHLCSGCGKEFSNLSSLTMHVNYRCRAGPAMSPDQIDAHRERCREATRVKRAKWRELYGYDRLPERKAKAKGPPRPPPACQEVEISSEGTW